MKKFLTVLVLFTLTFSLSACGGKKESEPASGTPEPTEAMDTTSEKSAENESADSQAVLDDYQAMLDRYNAVVDKVNEDENLASLEEVVNTISEISEVLDDLTDEINAAETITDADVADIRQVIAANSVFIDEMEAMVENYAGKPVITINTTVVNNSGSDIYELSISPANDESWGANLLTEPLKNGESGTLTMTLTEDSLVWDIMAADSQGTALEFMGLDFYEVDIDAGATITLGAPEGGEYTAAVE